MNLDLCYIDINNIDLKVDPINLVLIIKLIKKFIYFDD